MLKYLTLVIGSVAAASVPHFPSSGLTAQSIYECSPLAPHPPPSSVHDLRPDDIKVIAAIGDRYIILYKRIIGWYGMSNVLVN